MEYTFEDGVRSVLAAARTSCVERGHEALTSEHVLLALLESDGTAAAAILDTLLVSRAQVAETFRSCLPPPGRSSDMREVPYAGSAKRVLEGAMTAARRQGHTWVSTSHLLSGVLSREESTAARFLAEQGVDPEAVDAAIPNHPTDDAPG